MMDKALLDEIFLRIGELQRQINQTVGGYRFENRDRNYGKYISDYSASLQNSVAGLLNPKDEKHLVPNLSLVYNRAQAFARDPLIHDLLSDIPLRPAASSSDGNETKTDFGNGGTLAEGLRVMIALCVSALDETDKNMEGRGAALRLRAKKIFKTVPDQQIAPVKFGVEDDLLVVVHEPAMPDTQDERIVKSVRQALLKSGVRLIHELRQSQCDRRFIETIEDLQAEIEADQDIIQLGMQAQSCQVTSQAFGDEFPTFHQGLLAAHLLAVMDYVGQFPDWHRFLENAAGARMLEAEMIDSLRQVVRDLAGAVKNAPIAVPEVADELEWLAEQVAEETPVTKKVIYAVGQSLQNFAAAFVKWNLELAEKTSGKIQDLSAAGLAYGAVGFITYKLLSFVPISNVLAATPWLGPALVWMKEWLPMLSGG